MQVMKVKSDIYRVLVNSLESGIFYIHKGRTSAWVIKQAGETLGFAPSKKDALNFVKDRFAI